MEKPDKYQQTHQSCGYIGQLLICTNQWALIICTSCFTGSKDEELDSDDFEDDDEEDDNDVDEDEGVQNCESQEQAGAEALDNLRKYMDEMDQELQSTNIGRSFTQNNRVSLHRCCLSCARNLVKTFIWCIYSSLSL